MFAFTVVLAIFVIFVLLAQGGLIKNLQKENSALTGRLYNTNLIIHQQRKEIDAMLARAALERRNRQMAELANRPPLAKGGTVNDVKRQDVRFPPVTSSSWTETTSTTTPPIAPSPVHYGGASQDYKAPDSDCGSSSSNSDSGSPSSPDSACSPSGD